MLNHRLPAINRYMRRANMLEAHPLVQRKAHRARHEGHHPATLLCHLQSPLEESCCGALTAKRGPGEELAHEHALVFVQVAETLFFRSGHDLGRRLKIVEVQIATGGVYKR